jgi:replication initiation and membrane attachment protein DnaB
LLFTAKQSTTKVEKSAKVDTSIDPKELNNAAWEIYKMEQRDVDKRMSTRELSEIWAKFTDKEKEVKTINPIFNSSF